MSVKSAFEMFKAVKSVSIRYAPHERSSIFIREFLRVAQSEKVKNACPKLKLVVDVIEPPMTRLSGVDQKQSSIELELDDENGTKLKYPAGSRAYDIVREVNAISPPEITEADFVFKK